MQLESRSGQSGEHLWVFQGLVETRGEIRQLKEHTAQKIYVQVPKALFFEFWQE